VARSSETSVYNKLTRRHMPEDESLHFNIIPYLLLGLDRIPFLQVQRAKFFSPICTTRTARLLVSDLAILSISGRELGSC
jgi:hypothetical protein